MTNRRIFGFALLFAITASATVRSVAHAADKIASSVAGCRTSDNTTIDTSGWNTGQYVFRQTGTSGVAQADVVCPVDNFVDTIPITASVTAGVWKPNSDSVKVKACVTYETGGGGECGPADPNVATGIQQLSPSIPAWTGNPTSYRWLLFTLKRQTGGDTPVLFGYRQN